MSAIPQRPPVHDLSLLSLLAAHELERIRQDENSDRFYVSALIERLAEDVPAEGANVCNLAPSSAQMYRKAVHEATNEDPKDYDALTALLKPLIRQLKLISESTAAAAVPREDLTQVLKFVVSLHDQLLAQKHQTSSGRKTSQYRV